MPAYSLAAASQCHLESASAQKVIIIFLASIASVTLSEYKIAATRLHVFPRLARWQRKISSLTRIKNRPALAIIIASEHAGPVPYIFACGEKVMKIIISAREAKLALHFKARGTLHASSSIVLSCPVNIIGA